MTRRLLVALAVVSLLGASALAEDPKDEAKKPPFAVAVNRAIDAGVAWLKAAQRRDGSWGPCVAGFTYDGRSGGVCHETGPTSFALFTLAVCDLRRGDPIAKRGLEWLREMEKDHRHNSYESASLVLALAELNRPKDRRPLKRTKNPLKRPKGSRFTGKDWRWMIEHAQGLARGYQSKLGGYGYYGSGGDYADVSATQFAILALRAASRVGYPVESVDRDVWARTAKYLRNVQHRSGGFPYRAGEEWASGTTAAGLSSLLICREQMALQGEAVPPWLDGVFQKGRSHLGRNFDLIENRSPPVADGRGSLLVGKPAPRTHRGSYHYCHLYAIERVGRLSGRRELGGKDWYLRGATWLLAEQRKDGSWKDTTCMKPEDVLGTCFALLFLRRATVPVITPSKD